MFISIYGVFQKRFVDLSTCRILLHLSHVTIGGKPYCNAQVLCPVFKKRNQWLRYSGNRNPNHWLGNSKRKS